MAASLCCHCRRRQAQAEAWKRGLCWDCYRDLAVRALYPPRQVQLHHSQGAGPLPEAPTDAAPGSLEKLTVLAARAARREQLHHPDDAVSTDMNLIPSTTSGAVPLWQITLPDGRNFSCRRWTKSEARSYAKSELGLVSRRSRLPVGTVVRRVEG